MASLLALLLAAAEAAGPSGSVRIVGFSDYHSHAVPFYSESRPGQAGIARAIAYLREARRDQGTLVVSGGDMLNRGTPAWSDVHRCVEWPWLNGLVDAMALGNHDLDYGPGAFEACRRGLEYPVLSANLVLPDGSAYLSVRGKPYAVERVGGLRIGLLALAGLDLPGLVRDDDLPPGTTWAETLPTARLMVETLREIEGVHAVVLIGHGRREDDWALARAVPGIDLVFGSHSHLKSELVKIPGTETWYISPYQYLTYLAEVELAFRDGRLASVEGRLVPMDETRPEDPEVAAEVARLQAELEAARPERFRVVGRALVELSDVGSSTGESVIGNWATEVLRRAARAHVFFATASSFRGGIPPGPVTAEAFYAAIPYENEIVTVRLTGDELLVWLRLSLSKAGGDGFSQQTGLRYRLHRGEPVDVMVLEEPSRREAGFAPLDPERVYTLGTTDFQAFVASGYRERFARASHALRTGLSAHDVLLDALGAGPVAAALDGRGGGTSVR